ncbi:MAG: serine--tRNA ligase [Nanobdellota archaeon]
MLDINLIRENPETVRKDLRKRKDNEKLAWVDDLLEKDKRKRELQQKIDDLRHKRNEVTKSISRLKKEGSDASEEIKKAKELPQKIKELEEEFSEIDKKITYYLYRIPNLTHESVPYGEDDNDNQEVRRWGKPKDFDFELKNHGELIEEKGIGDFRRATKVAGKGFYYLKGDLALLNRALINFAVDFLTKRGYEFIEPPLMIKRDIIDGVIDYETFKEMVYNVEEEDLHLIATSEHPLMGMYKDEDIEELPKKYVGYSQCFRKEIGSHGVDEKGLFRVHQFHKVEQLIISEPDKSWDYFEELIKNSEEMFKELNLPYRVVNVCTGDLGVPPSKKYDLEVWMPRQEEYREACSCSNCTDYQARRLNIKHGTPGRANNPLAHSLNNTAIATSRALIAILENYQNEDGSVDVPKALQKYMGGKERI